VFYRFVDTMRTLRRAHVVRKHECITRCTKAVAHLCRSTTCTELKFRGKQGEVDAERPPRHYQFEFFVCMAIMLTIRSLGLNNLLEYRNGVSVAVGDSQR
jgi:hypothetical protein